MMHFIRSNNNFNFYSPCNLHYFYPALSGQCPYFCTVDQWDSHQCLSVL